MALLLPEAVVTVTPRAPAAAPAAIFSVAVIRVGPSILTSLTSTPEPLTPTVAFDGKLAPVNVSFTVDPACPLAGSSQTTVAGRFGAGGAGTLTPACSCQPELLPSPA